MPRLACVVLSHRCPPTLVEAVRSILEQPECADEAEVVVVNSGGGDAPGLLRRAGLDVAVIEFTHRLYVGGARNAGVKATIAPFVAFLAADCRAEPGWLAGRLRAHAGGAEAVASAVTNADPCNPFAWASYFDLFRRRIPWRNPEPLLYGASYARTLFDRYGLFRDDLETGEDTEFHARFAGTVPIVWAPDVRAAHRCPTGPRALLADQFRRGQRAGRYRFTTEGDSRVGPAAMYAWQAWKQSAVAAWSLQRLPEHRGPARRAALLLAPAVQPAAIAARLAGLATWRSPQVQA